MVKYTVLNDDGEINVGKQCEVVKFTCELNTYGMDEELLFPIRLNDLSDRKKKTNLATYLVKYKGFEKTSVKIKKNGAKEGFFGKHLRI